MNPQWTICTNIVSIESSKWIGTSWEFFDDEVDAEECFQRHIVLGNVPTKRKFHENDRIHLGAAHRM